MSLEQVEFAVGGDPNTTTVCSVTPSDEIVLRGLRNHGYLANWMGHYDTSHVLEDGEYLESVLAILDRKIELANSSRIMKIVAMCFTRQINSSL